MIAINSEEIDRMSDQVFHCNVLPYSYMQTTGSSLRKMIQSNQDTLDLFVRESIQNSLDAGLDNVDQINVDFKVGEFDSAELGKFYEKIGDSISKFGTTKFIAVSDSNTCGLLGNLYGNDYPAQPKQNLGNLVFNIMHAQQNAGSGGCWGIGKTVFYRMNDVGLIIYYSRILLDDGSYEERIISSLVEDENKRCLYPDQNDLSYVGISFYGEEPRSINGANKTCAITNTDFITKILNVFGLERYYGNKTGTIVITPFIDENYLIPSSDSGDESHKYPWMNELENYLKFITLRWYTPRMSEAYGLRRLNATINGETVKPDDEDYIFFKEIDKLFTAAKNKRPSDGVVIKTITRTLDMSSSDLGTFAYEKLNKPALKIDPLHGHFNYLPYVYAGLDGDDTGENLPIVTFVRKPGMAVCYRNDSKWVGNVSIDNNEFVIGVFVLNSENTFSKYPELTLEEYIRKGEKADHFDWFDHPISNENHTKRIVDHIAKSVVAELKNNFAPKEPETKTISDNVRWQNKLRSWLPTDMGNRSSRVTKRGGNTINAKTSHVSISSNNDLIFREDGSVAKTFMVSASSSFKNASIEIGLNATTGFIDFDLIELESKNIPFEIVKFSVVIDECDNKNLLKQAFTISTTANQQQVSSLSSQGFDFKLKYSQNGKCYGIAFAYQNKQIKMRIVSFIKIYDFGYTLRYKTNVEE